VAFEQRSFPNRRVYPSQQNLAELCGPDKSDAAASPAAHQFRDKGMHFRSIASGLALLLMSGTAGMTQGASTASHQQEEVVAGLFDLFESGSDDAPVVTAQAADPRVTELEDQIRKLTGTVEELNFQVLQMQDQIRKMQDDNEFRFEQLEKGTGAGTSKSGAGTNRKSEAVVSPPKDDAAAAGADRTGATAATSSRQQAEGDQSTGRGLPGVSLGTITVDKDGNVKSSSVGQPTDLLGGQDGASQDGASDGTAVAALPATDDPDELYRDSYQFILSGDYPTAEAGFRDHISRFPADPKAADAHYWLGEALLGQQKYRDAAETFLAASKDYPDAAKAPDMLFKLGVSLKALDQHDVACATFKEVGKRYPNSSEALKQRVKQEQALAAC
jgi:tol-pal system protein YbgF